MLGEEPLPLTPGLSDLILQPWESESVVRDTLLSGSSGSSLPFSSSWTHVSYSHLSH